MQKITIVEDDPAMREELVLLLENEGYQVQAVTEFTEVVAQVRAFGANLVLLDLGLPWPGWLLPVCGPAEDLWGSHHPGHQPKFHDG